jgi:photosystem II stability/assembly factor-like uncharacterized protein
MKKAILFFCMLTILVSNVNAQWVPTYGPISTYYIRCIACTGNNVFVGASDGMSGSLYLSTDNGTTWNTASTGLPSGAPVDILINGSDIFVATSSGVYLSTNNGTNWTAKNTGLTDLWIAKLAMSGSNLFAGTMYGKVFLSTNNGNSWTEKSTGLPMAPTISLATNGVNTFIGYPYPNNTIYKSTNNGTSWNDLATGLTATSIVFNGSNVFAASGDLYMSTNNGANWYSVSSGAACSEAFSILFNNSYLYTCGFDGCLSRTTAIPGTWTSVNTGLPNSDIECLAVNSTYMFAGTVENGVWKRPLSEFAGINENFANLAISISPNPAQDMLIIEDIAFSKDKIISVYNIHGQLLLQQPILHDKTNINISNLNKGVYIVKVVGTDINTMKKIIKD